ncbi:VOC family protein [Granulicella cerasi]|uniref:VOC family protein n=1 Tax=Granulicella cerasi TaxID=741063 RepID=A0ABW1ZB13_9BACT|nr:VOC family protein [Granulicella cerasi]
MNPIVGLHHVTAIASDPQQNLDFYTEVLGLRLVKRTVNFDDPGTYHFYFGDDTGTPGTVLTFFPWPHARRGSAGAGEVTHTAFSIPANAVEYWHQRLTEKGVLVERSGKRFDGAEDVLTLADPDGMKLELVAIADAPELTGSRYADVPQEYAIRGFFGVTMLHLELAPSEGALNLLGFVRTAEEGNRFRFRSPDGAVLGNQLDIVVDPNAGYGRSGAGSVHHIAFRATDDASEVAWQQKIGTALSVTPVLDRQYFHSVYFREPGGVLYELATDNPGFLYDEDAATLGEMLKLPTWIEPQRELVEARVLPITMSQSSTTAKEAE